METRPESIREAIQVIDQSCYGVVNEGEDEIGPSLRYTCTRSSKGIWKIRVWPLMMERVGGPDDGKRTPFRIHYDLAEILMIFSRLVSIDWYSDPVWEGNLNLSRVCIRGYTHDDLRLSIWLYDLPIPDEDDVVRVDVNGKVL